jgi:tetratricopeptide (TPR) repeat protein
MRIVTLIIVVIMLITASANVYSAQDELTTKQKQDLIKSYYEVAITCYQQEEYGKAIHYWEQILKLDPEQVQPPRLIEVAKKQLLQANALLLSNIEKTYTSGKYEDAINLVNQALETDPQNSELTKMRSKLQTISDIFGDLSNEDKISGLMCIAVTNYLKPTGNIKTSVNATIYGLQLSSEDAKLKKFMQVLTTRYPEDTKSVQAIKGMNLIEQKLVAALNHIYDGKYDCAIVECNEVLELEPENILALKRLGSSYYALGKEQQAKRIWRQAQRLAPKDEELKMFLKQ